MVKNICLVLLFIFPFIHCHSQILPKEGSELNYRIVPFSFPESVGSLTLEIASGRYFSEDSFRKNIVLKKIDTGNKIIAEVPAFGSQYTWRITPNSGAKSGKRSSFYHFSTGIIPEVDTSQTRLRIIQPAREFKDAYIFGDGAKVLYDLEGNPVWYLPPATGITNSIRDLKLTSWGTITFLERNVYEINYNGAILWKAPDTGKVSGTEKENFHHEITKLSNGHFMVLGNEFLAGKMQYSLNGGFKFVFVRDVMHKILDSSFRIMPFGTIIEYDNAGNVVWSWKTSKYYEESDLVYYKPLDVSAPIIDFHDNSFCFDENNQIIYLNYKNIDRIIKIKYPEGKVIRSYGETYGPGGGGADRSLFCGAHSVRVSHDGCILLFNNKICDTGSWPDVVKLKEPEAGGSLKKIWEYNCKSQVASPTGFPTGGNVVELPGGSILVSTAAPDSRVFMVNMKKKILWDAAFEKWSDNDKKWVPLAQFRASIIESRKDLERLIWQSANDE